MARDHGEAIGRSSGCRRCGRKRGMIRRHGSHEFRHRHVLLIVADLIDQDDTATEIDTQFRGPAGQLPLQRLRFGRRYEQAQDDSQQNQTNFPAVVRHSQRAGQQVTERNGQTSY